jgi:hypothetical protein
MILGEALSESTWASYKSAVAKYRDYMSWNKLDENNPSEVVLCKWISFLSLFVEPISICRYLSAVRYFLAERGGCKAANSVIVTRMVRGVCKRYGLPQLDDREIVTVQLLLLIMKAIDLGVHDDRCCMAACIVAFLNCLRCGEFTVKSGQKEFLTRGDWEQEGDRGQIYLKKCKTDVFGRGHWLKYRRMKSNLDPCFWMSVYANEHKLWSGKSEEPLFMTSDKKPLSRVFLIGWVRKYAKLVGHPRADKLNGISFRRGGAEALRECGYKMEEFGVLGRWLTARAAARYVRLTDPIVDEFARAFDSLVKP